MGFGANARFAGAAGGLRGAEIDQISIQHQREAGCLPTQYTGNRRHVNLDAPEYTSETQHFFKPPRFSIMRDK